MKEENVDNNIYRYKIILIGDSFVGKTSLIIRFCDEKFAPNSIATIGIDTKTKFIIRKEKKIELQIWDTAGQERFRSLSKNCCNQMDGIVFVYDINNRETFKNIKLWYKNIKNVVNYKIVGTVLVGNKCDIKNPQVDDNSIQKFCNTYNMKHIKVSAKENINVDDIFTTIVDIMVKLDNKSKRSLQRARSKIAKMSMADEEELQNKKKKNCC